MFVHAEQVRADVALTRNVRAYLLGIDKQPQYVLSRKNPRQTTERIARWWSERWLTARIGKDEALGKVAGHNLLHPIRHGARVAGRGWALQDSGRAGKRLTSFDETLSNAPVGAEPEAPFKKPR
jgi:hypothetical protein